MKKLALAVGGTAAAISMAVVGAAQANAAPDVTGETYNSAKQILQAQGFSTMFAGSVGSDAPQSKCIVIGQTSMGSAIGLRLDCTKATVAAAAAAGPNPAAGPAAPGGPPGAPAAVVPGAAPVPGGFPQVGVPVAVG